MSPILNRSSALQHFECSNAVEIRNGRMFDFYLGLPHIYMKLDLVQVSLIQGCLKSHSIVHILIVSCISESKAPRVLCCHSV